MFADRLSRDLSRRSDGSHGASGINHSYATGVVSSTQSSHLTTNPNLPVVTQVRRQATDENSPSDKDQLIL